MDSPNIDKDLTKSMLSFAGGILAFCASVIGVVNNRLQKAKTKEQKKKVIENTIVNLGFGLCIAGIIFLLPLDMTRTGFWLIAVGLALELYVYGKSPNPATRREVIVLSLLAFTAACAFSIYWFSRLIHVIERLTEVVEELSKKVNH
jgi:peptidoglycan/LPS O-acetylase OafA/YrhL